MANEALRRGNQRWPPNSSSAGLSHCFWPPKGILPAERRMLQKLSRLMQAGDTVGTVFPRINQGTVGNVRMSGRGDAPAMWGADCSAPTRRPPRPPKTLFCIAIGKAKVAEWHFGFRVQAVGVTQDPLGIPFGFEADMAECIEVLYST